MKLAMTVELNIENLDEEAIRDMAVDDYDIETDGMTIREVLSEILVAEMVSNGQFIGLDVTLDNLKVL